LEYDPAYRFSEAKINPATDRVVFYSYTGMRLCDLPGNVVAETAFPDPFSVKDTQYDKESGNVAVLYEDRLRLYSGIDASLLVEKQGKPGVKSVFYTPFGVSVLDANGTVALYDLASGQATAEGIANPVADCALPLGAEGLVTVQGSRVFWGRDEIGSGELIGAGKTGGGFAFAVSDGANGAVFTAESDAFIRRFAFEVAGDAEAYFTGEFVFISPAHGNAAAYTLDGVFVRTLDENGYLAETEELGEYIAAGYVSSSSERYTLLLDAETLETAAHLPGFWGEMNDGTLILDGGGSLRATELRDVRELMAVARERLGSRTLTPDETQKFKAG
jgi:hypothetical protein